MKPIISNAEKKIVEIFKQNVYGKKADTTSYNQRHDGNAGHWLEKQMGVKSNASNTPDLHGFEMKNSTTSKTTFGDWSASYYIFRDSNYDISRDKFMEVFGKPNAAKDNRPSWSGSAIPNFKSPSRYNGSIMSFDCDDNICIVYNYSNDPRAEKELLVPKDMQRDDIILARWDSENLREKLTNKFGVNGWFICRTDHNNYYSSIEFGEPMTFENWISLVERGIVFFDSGMYYGNNRNYSQWRANNQHWESLITRKYPPFPCTMEV